MPPINKETKGLIYDQLLGESYDPDDPTFERELLTRYVLECRMGMAVTYCGDCPNFLGCGLVRAWQDAKK